ncbi:NTP transferase domain-containing protein [Metabacillus schmidteae]|uniref:NTP transferase domain-containing protein n=1 Tax=Metabacillus schmidteae TaxID=2730405 RepID=UPI001588D4FF|nr:NTP transferase domain-containing protein [Metabacillus schmidteae]
MSSYKQIVGIYLAAGHSSRMGTCKLSLPLAGYPLGTMALKEIVQSKINSLIIVTKDIQTSWLRSVESVLTSSVHWENIICLQAHLGQSYSLKIGIQRAIQIGADSVVIFLADQPFITSHMIDHLIQQSKKEKDFVAAFDGEHIKPPILFHQKAFPYLLSISGDQGARSLLKKGVLKGLNVLVDPAKLIDIDTKEHYENIQKRYNEVII